MKILIIEDEARIARRISRMTREIFGTDLQSLTVCNDIETGLQAVAEKDIDLLFLDLNLNGKDGFDILESVVAESFHTVIISAHRERAIRAFEYGVLDFVPKPFDQERLQKACDRIRSKTREETGIKFLAVKKKGRQVLLKIEDITYIQGAGIYTELKMRNGKTEICNKSLETLHTLLPQDFERIHKSYLVPMSQAKGIHSEPGSRYKLELTDGTFLPIGRSRYKDIRERWFS